MEQLKPCPFCGSKYVRHTIMIMNYGYKYKAVACQDCGATMHGNYDIEGDLAVQAWNHRAERLCHIQTHSNDGCGTCESCDQCDFEWYRSINDKPFSYCPNCGAKVVSND